jgi:hypothetical protein
MLFVLLLALPCWATNYYVGGTGASDANSGLIGFPEATLQAGVDDCSDGDTVYVAEGTYGAGVIPIDLDTGNDAKNITVRPLLTNGEWHIATAYGVIVNIQATMATGSITLIGMHNHVSGSGDTQSKTSGVVKNASAAVHVTMTSCNITDDTAGAGILYRKYHATQAVNLTCTNCTFRFAAGGFINTGTAQTNAVRQGNFLFDTCTMEWGGANHGCSIDEGCATVAFRNCTFHDNNATDSGYMLLDMGSMATYTDLVEFRNCLCESGEGINRWFSLTNYIRRVWCEGSTLTLKRQTSRPMEIGYEPETDGLETDTSNPILNVYFGNNYLTHTGADATHTIFLGLGPKKSIIENNTVIVPTSTAMYNVIVKADNAVIRGNKIYGGDYALGLYGGRYMSVTNNTVVSRVGGACVVKDNQDYVTGTSTGGVLTRSGTYSFVDDAWNTGFYLIVNNIAYTITHNNTTTITATGLPDNASAVPYFVNTTGTLNANLGAPMYLLIRDNIFVNLGTAATDYAFEYAPAVSAIDEDVWCPNVDYNLYWSAGTNLATRYGPTTATVAGGAAGMQTYWDTIIAATAGSPATVNWKWQYNDRNSRVANPGLTAAGVQAGKWTPNGNARRKASNGGTIGAVQPSTVVIRRGG